MGSDSWMGPQKGRSSQSPSESICSLAVTLAVEPLSADDSLAYVQVAAHEMTWFPLMTGARGRRTKKARA